MKEITAFVRPNMVQVTKDALADAGFPSFTCQPVLGRGKKHLDFGAVESFVESGDVPANHTGEALTEPLRLIAKRMFTLIVEDEDVSNVVRLIIDVNSTKTSGDGKIFVQSINESYRIRNGETSADAY